MAAVTSSSSQPVALTPAEIPSQSDLLIALHLHLWPALTFAIQNGWGTSNSQIGEDKRDWLAGAISDLFAQKQLRDLEDLEDVLEQVMSDEFEVVVEDGTLEEVARNIWIGVSKVNNGDGSEVKELMSVWQEKKRKGQAIGIVKGAQDDNGDSEDGDEDNGFSDSPVRNDGAMDVNMDEAPALIDVTKQKIEPEIDEDGFTKVTSKKKR